MYTYNADYKPKTLSQAVVANSVSILKLGSATEHDFRIASMLHGQQRRDPKFRFEKYLQVDGATEAARQVRSERVQAAKDIIQVANPLLYASPKSVTAVWTAVRVLEKNEDTAVLAPTDNSLLERSVSLVALRAIVRYALTEFRLPHDVITNWENTAAYHALEILIKPEVAAKMTPEEKNELKLSLILLSAHGESVEALLS